MEPEVIKSLAELAQKGRGDELKAKLSQLDWKRPIDEIRVGAGKRQGPFGGTVDHPGETLLQEACTVGNESTIRALVELGASPLLKTESSDDYFDIACACGYATPLGVETCMHLAARSDCDASVVDILRRAEGCEDIVNARSRNRCTPLMVVPSAVRCSARFRRKPGRPFIGEQLRWTKKLLF